MFHSLQIKGTFRPLQDWVILKPIAEPVRKRGGIVLPDNVKDYGRCEVMAVGPGTRGPYGDLKATELKPGQFVYLQKFVDGECSFVLNGERVFAMRERHANCTIED